MELVKSPFLVDGGQFLIDVFVPNLQKLSQHPLCEIVMSEYDDPNCGGRVVVTVTSTYESDTQIKKYTTRQKFHRGQGAIGHLNMRMFFPREISALLKYNCF